MEVPFSFKGRWAGLTFYPLPGVGNIGRQYWGPSAEDIKTKAAYDITRRNNKEHGGCSTASKYLRRVFHPLEPARDYAMSGPVTGKLRDFLPLDTESEFGHRHILLSKAPRLLEGINLSKRYPFDSVVRGGVSCALNRETLSATIDLPALKVGVNFTPTGKQPYFKIAAALGVAPDLLWNGEAYAFHRAYEGFRPLAVTSDWTPATAGSEAMTLDLQLPYTPPDDQFALVLTLGVLMGTAGRWGQPEAVKYAGCAKVMAAG